MGHWLERFYPWVPVWAQNLGISLYGLAWRNERLGGDFERYVAEFRERDRWSVGQMESYVEAELRRVLLRAFDQVPYYRERWQAAGLSRAELARFTPGDLPRIPTTPKQELRADPDAFVALDSRRGRKLRRYYTSGSTGTPVTAVCTAEEHRRFIAAREARSYYWAGTSLRLPRSMIGGRLVVPKGIARPPFHRYNWSERQVYLSAYHLSPPHAAQYVRALNRYRPRVLTGYAYSHYTLARLMCEQGLKLAYQPDALVLGSEKLTPAMKETIRNALRARAYEEYGAVEECVLASECERGSLHANQDFGCVEIVDERGIPVQPGREGRVVCTSLLRNTQLLVRYEIGDLGVWSEELCPCGRDHLPVLKEVVGRLEDAVIGPDGREMVRFHGIFIDLPSVVEGQVVQEAIDRFVVNVVTADGFGEREVHAIRSRFAERLGDVQVDIRCVTDLPRTERGKFRAVISHVATQNGTPAHGGGSEEA